MANTSWEDWRIVGAIAECGTTAGAAEKLGLNQSTVFRRISQFEEQLGVRLFDRDKRGFRLTLQGEAILPDIVKLEYITADIERRVTGLDEHTAGEVTLSVNMAVVRYLLANHLEEFLNDHPDIVVHLDVSDRLANIRQREADLVIRGHNDPDPDLFGRRIMRLSYAIYTGADQALAEEQSKAFASEPASLDWVLLSGELLKTAPGQWMTKHLSDVSSRVTATSVEIAADLAARNLGCAVLPRFVAERHSGLTRISEPIPGLYTELWVLTHQDLRKTARVSALLKFIAKVVHQSNELL